MKVSTGWPAGLCLASVALLSACGASGENETAHEEAPPPPVEVVTVQAGPAAAAESRPGRISPVRVAEVRSRVAGIVLKREFEEGMDVQAGQVLFRIDPSPFQAQLSEAQGALAKAEAELKEAQAQASRLQPLVEVEAISRQDFDVAQTRVQTARAGLRSGQAAVESAQIQLSHATVRAPIAGRIGRALVTEGALVGQDGSTPMALIQQLDPVYADFSQPVGDALRLRAAAKAAGDAASPKLAMTIEIPEIGETRSGELLFSDITVEPDTGRIAMRGQFDNADGMLLPGMFVRVSTAHTQPQQIITVPQRAVVRNPDGSAGVMVVDAQRTVVARSVETGRMHNGQWQVLSGLQAGEQIVASGVAKVQPGMQLPQGSGEEAAVLAPASSDANP
ncbi:efflux RND transporter periplasmic adaptor subunit [Luteimonas deserti]|uniref:Efflux RND transporter periplasmic adaptor subunit n=1 Tax=Luteimonas deserti TaxID=2752306 RepID=A0A7Z0TTP8_9GAMM|nr:efflux RND transporter periplasmic adaptor subunit [Luteimonas deserti]NYZ62016.1 efflux RND transporter periplasmic adaptor subunit [Luteimonas deserti]